MLIQRYLEDPIREDLTRKMVFLVGPRQVGKTTLAKAIIGKSPEGLYLSWDRREDRKEIRSASWPAGEALVVLDELHKYRPWKRWIKGEYDHHRDHLRFLITGSARMDVYRRGGDSLQGRYHHYRLHPLSVAEAQGLPAGGKVVPPQELPIAQGGKRETVDALLRFSGFPEPWVAKSERQLRRWRKERLDRFFREDVRDLETVRDLSSMEILSELVAERVGSPLSINSLREDLEVSHRAVTHWIEILDRLYFLFRLRPYSSKAVRSLRKMPKVYLWDMSPITNPGARFENLIALHLLKLCHYLEDTEGYRVEVGFLRDAAGREVDFLVTADGKPWFQVECKLGDFQIDPSLEYYRARLKIPWSFQVVLEGDRDFVKDGIRCLPAHRFLGGLV